MNILSRLAVLLALLAALILGYLLLFRQGGCDRDDVPDEDPEPACQPTDKECKVGKPAPSTPPPIGAP